MSEEVTIGRRKGLYGFEYLVDNPDLRRKPKSNHYNIKQLWQRNHEIINLAVRGFNQVTIADILGVSTQCVSDTLNSDLGKHKLAELRRTSVEEARIVQEKIRVLTNKALQVYNEIFDDESGECNLSDKKKVADTIVLELSGLRAPTKVHSTHASYTLSKEDIDAMKIRALDEAEKAGIVIDIERPKEIVHDSVD